MHMSVEKQSASTPENARAFSGRSSPRPAAQNPPSQGRKIWIDLENSPHIPFFKPIIQELERRGHSVMITARDCFQVCQLADLFDLPYKRIGHHYGKNKLAKVAGLGIRALQLGPTVLREKPDLALSHGSRSLLLLSSILRIPTITIFDYEHAKWWGFLRPTWVMAPEIIPVEVIGAAAGVGRDRILRYPGIKEDVYAPFFRPHTSIQQQLGLNGDHLVVTVRPPATEAHYHNAESELLLHTVLEFLGQQPNVKIVLLPRTGKQEAELHREWPELFADGRIIVPEHVVDGLDLIWHSDLVISGGGTMNREAAALGVPVYSIFRGKLGSVDGYLAETGHLVLLASPQDVRNCIDLKKRKPLGGTGNGNFATRNTIVDNIARVLETV